MQIFFFVLLLVTFVSTVSSQFYQNHGSERIPRQIYDDFKYSRRGRQARWPWPQPQDNIPRQSRWEEIQQTELL
ncbi:hypothetical protein ANCCEY_13277 [Ancylostoma ceylanicum]|uniref:Uncharacterized protein n=1 Tax=Ancylostoma ceylanicum TaxID=53326 RepID=A0A0D6L7V5_9BILA|nr:hypothetical protein ANCCEY_13277 [Ancylostoma ceylanicum]